MKIFVTGTRGIPDIPGGVESLCQQLYPLIVKQGHEVKISRRRPYTGLNIYGSRLSEWSGVQLVDNYTPKNKKLETIVHTFMAILEAKKWNADIIHIHAVGPGILVPFARLLGLKVVITNHGSDYDRDKWGRLAKLVLRSGEKIGGVFANEVIVISEVIRKTIKIRCQRDSHLIYNGVYVKSKTSKTTYIDSFGLVSGSYILSVARFVPEKGFHDLIEAYNYSGLTCKLVLAGDADYEDDYSRSLKKMAAENPNIILTGYITGDELHQIYSHAGLFVLPSYHEGLSFALIEALSYGLITLVSDIPANLEIDIDSNYYFRCKDVQHLKDKLIQLWHSDFTNDDREQLINLVRNKYNWQQIAAQTIEVYRTALKD